MLRIGQPTRRRRNSAGPIALLLGTAWLSALGPAQAEPEAASDAVPPPVALDALLQLPKAAPPLEATDRRAALDRKQWESRFQAARDEIASAQAALARAQSELEELASQSDAWQMAPPGASANAENSPVSYKLRQEIRQRREEVERAERALGELRIEANLAGVPEEWQN